MGGVAGRLAPSYACSRRPGAAPASRLGQRRLDVRFTGGWQCRFRQPAAMDLAQLRLEELDRLELEHGICRCDPSARRDMARPALHQGCADTSGARETVLAGECRRRVQRAGSRAAHRLRRDHLAWRRNGRRDNSDRAVLYRTPRRRYGRHNQRAAFSGQESDSHTRHLRSVCSHSRHAAEHDRVGLGLCNAPSGERHCGHDDSRRRRDRHRRRAFRCRPHRVSRAVRGRAR